MRTWIAAGLLGALSLGCGSDPDAVGSKETSAAKPAPSESSERARKRVELELQARGMPSFQGSAILRVLEPHASVATPTVLSISGSRTGGDFLTLDLLVSLPTIVGRYPLISTKHGEAGSHVSALLDGVALESDGGEATVTAIDANHVRGAFTVHLVGFDHDRAPMTVEGTFEGKLRLDCSVLSDAGPSNQGPEWVQDEKLESATCRGALETLGFAE